MIRKFRHQGLKAFFTRSERRGIDAKQADRIGRIRTLMRSNRDPKRKPTHPGEVLREDVLPALKMTQTESPTA